MHCDVCPTLFHNFITNRSILSALPKCCDLIVTYALLLNTRYLCFLTYALLLDTRYLCFLTYALLLNTRYLCFVTRSLLDTPFVA